MTHTLLHREPITQEEWAQRLAQAEELRRLEVDCVMCAGSGGWPGHVAGTLVLCKPCDGTGRAKSFELSTKGCEL